MMRANSARERRERVMALVKYLQSFARDESGQDLLEYALLVALIALVAFGAVQLAGSAVNTIFTNIANQLQTVAG
jgi:pilus assembly protein Flp/PilA